MGSSIQLKRGLKANLPVLLQGEPAFTTDEKELYVGTAAGNVKVSSKSEIELINEELKDIVPQTEKGTDIVLGSELLDESGWTTTGWTGDFATGFTHAVGQAPALTRTLTSTGTKKYLIEFDVESPTNTGSPDASVAFTVIIGNSPKFAVYRSTGNQHFAFGITSVSDGDLQFLPCNPASLSTSGSGADTTFNGTIKNISLKEIIASATTAVKLKDKDGNVSSERRQVASSLLNEFNGKSTGLYNYNGDGNSGLGNEALANNTSGFWNTAIGRRTLYENTVGSRNVAIGTYALKDLTSGNRNIAIGTFALEKNKDGRNNIAIGADAIQYSMSCMDNIAIGLASLGSLSTGDGSIAIGKSAVGSSTTPSYEIGIGEAACAKATGYANIGIGRYAAQNITTGDGNVAIGNEALKNNATGRRNVAIGEYAGAGAVGANFNYCVLIGRNAGAALQSGDHVMIGFGAGIAVTTGAANLLIGKNAGSNITTGSGNIIIGNDLTAPAADSSSYLNIGNFLYGRIVSSKYKVGIGVQSPSATLHLGASNGAPYTAPLRIDAGTLLASYGSADSGSIEYDGTNLYFINSSGVRKTLAVV